MGTKSNNTGSTKNKAKLEARKRSQKRNQTGTFIGLGVLAALLVVVAVLVFSNPPTGEIEGVVAYSNLDRGHSTEPVTYAQIPPVGGIHNPVWQNCGVYTSPVTNENAVHSLEHGAIWITYQPDLPADQVEELQTLTRQSGFRLLSPYPDLPSPVVVSAWGYQLKLDNAGDTHLNAFIEKYEQNPQGPEPGAPCTGGVGAPL